MCKISNYHGQLLQTIAKHSLPSFSVFQRHSAYGSQTWMAAQWVNWLLILQTLMCSYSRWASCLKPSLFVSVGRFAERCSVIIIQQPKPSPAGPKRVTRTCPVYLMSVQSIDCINFVTPPITFGSHELKSAGSFPPPPSWQGEASCHIGKIQKMGKDVELIGDDIDYLSQCGYELTELTEDNTG